MNTKGFPTQLKAFFIGVLSAGGILLSGQPARAQVAPVINNLYPSGVVQFQPSATLSFNASSSAGIDPSGIFVQLSGTSLSGQTSVTTLTAASGLIITGTPTSRTVSAPLSSNTVYTASINVIGLNSQSTSTTVSFDTINPADTFEAEDFDYGGGQFINNPQTNKYAGLNVTYGVDAQNGNFGEGNNAYRPSGLNTEGNGDIPRLAYGTGLQDYDVGWNNGGNWANYTRTFPAGTFNIYMRAANPNGATADAAGMALVTSGRGTSSQSTTNMGTFSIPDTGSWQVYTWVPLLDANGNLARFSGGAVKTLRVTTDNANYNANFYLLMPADLSLPVITNLYPDGSSFFQYTNQLSFVANASAGMATAKIVVILDGTNMSNVLSFDGSFTSWHVNCPLALNATHTAVITVTGNNGQSATTTVTFSDFSSTNFQWEAEDYDYNSGNYFDNPQTNAYAGLPSTPEVDNHQFDLNGNSFIYRTKANGACPSTTVAGDGQRPQFFSQTDYNIGFFGGGSWVNYTRHYPTGTYYVWGRFAEGQTNTEAILSQLISGYGTSAQTTTQLGAFYIPFTGGWSTWAWSPLSDANGNPLKVRFDGSQQTLQLGGSPVGGQPEVNVNFLMLVPTVPDPFTVLQTVNNGTTNVQILYSKPVEAASATNIANYVFTNGVAITGASLNPDNVTVVLTTAPLAYGSNYWLVINGVRDRMNLPNTIATNTTVNLQVLSYTLKDIGNPPVISTVVNAGNGVNVTAVGSDFGGNSDQGNFSYQIYSGNFDVEVRVAGLALSDIFAKAGLMARETLDPASRFAASIATPAMNGCFFEWRDPAGSVSSSSGNFPANYPNTWLRLQRVGNVFNSYAGYDGQAWSQLGSATITMSNQVYLGFSVSSHSTNQTTTAQFRDMSNETGAVVGTQINPHEQIGPSSRTTPIAFSEIMYKPAARTDGNNIEFIEIYNSNSFFQDISGYQIVCADMNYKFPPNTVIPGGAFFVVAASPSGVENVYGLTTNVFGPYTGSLKKSETLQLLDEQGAVLLTVPYSSTYPWPVAADGTGHSIVLANPTYGEGDPRAWDISDTVGGSPGQMDGFTPSPLRNVVINEILPHSENATVPRYIELYNHSTNMVDVSGCILTDDASTDKFIIPPGTLIPPGGFASFQQLQFGFTLNGAGETLYFIQSDGSRVLDAVQFGAQSDGVAYGRWPDGANDFYAFTSRTPGTNNSSILIGDIVINELMYNPISGNDDDQYIELYNKGTNTINMAGWQFTSGVTFTFPNISIAPNGYLTVARNLTNLFGKYSNLNSLNTVGNYSGKLSHNGEQVTLSMPQTLNTNTTILVAEDQVTYGTGGRWGEWADGGGSSLELKDPRANHRLAANWADSDETQKSVWTNIETTGVLDNGANYEPSIAHAQIGILDVGECLVDNIEVDYNGVNYISNSTFESGTSGWSFQGCMTRSSLENTGYLSSHSLHIRSSDHVWTGDNSCQVALNANSLAPGQTATLRFKARWLHGWPEALLRLNGNWLEAAGAMPVPKNLGTPGMPNSQYVTNAGPAIYNVTHSPALPAANQSVVVTAQAHDPNGVQNLTLYYRLDPASTYTAVPMKDDGTGGDAVANDGIFSATIPGQAANQLAAYYISATDSNSVATRFPALLNDNSPARECLVLFGDGNPGGSFDVYHLWVTQANATRWDNLGNLSNEGIDCTFVNGNRVIYNSQAHFAGSPYHQDYDLPYGPLCNYKWIFPDDDKLLGATSFNKIHQPGNGAGDDASIQREQLANTFLRVLGVPWLNRRYVAVYVNGNRRGTLMEDAQTPDSDVVKEHYPNDPDGYLYKMQPWFEFAPTLSGASMNFDNQSWITLNNYTTIGGAKKTARYRYNFLVRRTPDSASDFNPAYSIVDAANSYGTPNYVADLENVADMENWMRVFAANHAAGNWDSFGAQNGQNLYGYAGTLGTKYSLLMFDFNIVFGNQDFSWGPGQNLFTVNPSDPYLNDIYNTPVFRRMYWRALQELVNGPLNVANSGPLLDAKYNVFAANGFDLEDPNTNIKPWLSQAQSSIASQLAAVDAASFVVNPGATTSNNVAYVTGSAPVNVATVWINGVAYPLTWTTLNNWIVTVPLTNGLNNLSVVGVDKNGRPITGDSNSVSITYGGTNASPAGQIVVNEIMYGPAVAGAQFVELYNNSTNITFDLSGWQLPELAYTFPGGSIIGPANYLVLAANRGAFAMAYGATSPVFDSFNGTLSPNGQTLTLVQPGTNVAVTKVEYENHLPWPANANGTGASLQLIDPYQDNWRAGNWAAVLTNTPVTPQWTYVTTTGTASSSLLYIYLQSAGDVYMDDIKLVTGSVPEAGANVLSDGDFESGFPGPWTVSANLAGSVLSTTIKHSGNASLHVISTSVGTTQSSAIWQTMSPALTTNATYTLSFWYLQSTNGGPLTIRLSGSGVIVTVDPAPPVMSTESATPDILNSVAVSLPSFPSLWINEVQADNLTGITNSAGQHTGWLELYNPSTNIISLSGLYLANNYANLLQWAFPAGAVINPGQFKIIFADGQTGLSTLNELHTSFVLASGTGSLALTRLYNGQPQVLDYVDYENISPNDSYGSFPDGQSFIRQEFFQATPGAANNGTATPPPSFVDYAIPGAAYSQNFDSLPDPGATSVNTANPVMINGVTYSLANPFDFAFPAAASGGKGGLGISALAGWYGLGVASSKFGATDGDQTTGGQVSFGLPGSSNRALGLLATSSTKGTAFGVRFINGTASTLSRMNLQVTGEVWRQSNVAKTLQFYYAIDPTGTNSFPIGATAFIPALNISIPATGPVGGGAVDGTSSFNQTNLSVSNQSITNWPPGAALWLVWQMTDSSGNAQGLGLDNLSFSANASQQPVSLDIQVVGAGILLSWPSVLGVNYQIEYKDDLAAVAWTPLGSPVPGTGGSISVTNDITLSVQRFYRIITQ
jgi:regulation of enolase protein 1 (concanavalin A-like superfamily)